MLRSGRFYISLILVAFLVVCFVLRWRKNSDIQQTDVPKGGVVICTTAMQTTTMSTLVKTKTVATTAAETTTQPEYKMTAAEPYLSRQKAEWMRERAGFLAEQCPDFVGWLYIADTEIDYAVVRGNDNSFYLHHAPDGRELDMGSIFLDYRCDRSFSDSTNILFGHNMKVGMFADIRQFKKREVFDSHRYGWLVTPEKLFRIDFFALSVVSAYDELYDVPTEGNEWAERFIENAMFTNDIEFAENDRYIALSTCSYEFENARTLFVGKLVPEEVAVDCIR